MASSPRWKVYDAGNHYQGCTKEPESAAALAQFYGDGATVRNGHTQIVWTEGIDVYDSWDEVAETIRERLTRVT